MTPRNFMRHAGAIKSGGPALFLDRDGVINHDCGYVSRVEDVQLLLGAASAIRRINEAGIPVIVVSNQSGLGRGRFDVTALDSVQGKIETLLEAEGARLDAVFLCGAHPDETGALATWRKPAPGMFLAAQALFGIDLAESVIIGDKKSDLAAGAAAGLRRGLLVGGGVLDEPLPASFVATVLPDLAAACDHAMNHWFVRAHACV